MILEDERTIRPLSARPSSATNNRHQDDSTTTALEHELSSSLQHSVTSTFQSRPDVEEQRLPQYTAQNDPYQLASKLKTTSELDQICANTSRKRDGCGSLTTNSKASRARKVESFYRSQNANIERLLKPVDDHRREAKQTKGDSELRYKIAVNSSLAANIILAGLQVYGAVSSGSLSLITTMADALFDPLSNITLMVAHRAVNKVDPRKFPSGKARIENVGNITFCFLMAAVSAIIIAFSVRDLVVGSESGTKGFHLPSIIAVSVAFGVKLLLFMYCWALRDIYSQVRILWEDHRNDLFVNGLGILTSVGGSKLRWYVDPIGATVISCAIVALWLHTAYTEFQLLIGRSADTEMLQLITYICKLVPNSYFGVQSANVSAMTHSPFVRAIDTVRAYHSGPRLIVEVDVVMDPEETLRATHDIAEELQFKLEGLPDVERAYVHVDYETSHAPEHFLKKEL